VRHLFTGFRLYFLLSVAVAAAPATATVINFDAQAAGSGGNLTGIPDSPLTIGIATFTGGELRGRSRAKCRSNGRLRDRKPVWLG